MATQLKINVENIGENQVGKMGRIQATKKFGVASTNEITKRAALGELGNRAPVLRANSKEGQKDNLKDPKCQIKLRATKARVDSNWCKKPVANSTKLTRSNSVKTIAPNGLASKPKTITVKSENIENKVSQVKVITKSKPEAKPEGGITIRREDSNLSLRSLSKLKAAFKEKKERAAAPTITAVQKSQVVHKNEIKIVSVQSHSAKLLNEVENIDSDDAASPIHLSEYVNDIYSYLYHLEVEFPIEQNYLQEQREVNPKMRSVLIDWINEVHYQFRLVPETFQMTVAIIDRYLQAVRNTTRQHLQLVGVTALFIASKYEELYPPAIGDFVYITDDTYNKAEILAMEMRIMKSLGWNLARPLPIHFLRRYSKAAKAADFHHTSSKYFLELLSTDYTLVHYRPSEIAAASLLLALRVFNENPKADDNKLWTPTLEFYSRYTCAHLRPLVHRVAQIVNNAPNAKLKAVYEKYQSSKFDKISTKSELYGKAMDAILKENIV